MAAEVSELLAAAGKGWQEPAPMVWSALEGLREGSRVELNSGKTCMRIVMAGRRAGLPTPERGGRVDCEAECVSGRLVIVAFLATLALLGCSKERPQIEVDHLRTLATQVVAGGSVDLGEDGNPRWVGAGWNSREARAQWSASTAADLVLPLREVPRDARLRLRVMGARRQVHPTQLELRINERELPAVALPSELEDIVIDVPDGVLRAGHNRVVIGCDSLVPSGRRQLGVLVDRIDLDGVAKPSPAKDDTLRLDADTWIEDSTFTLGHGPMHYTWTHSGEPGELRLEALDVLGQTLRVTDRIDIQGRAGEAVLAPAPDLGPLQTYRLVYDSPDESSELRLQSAMRSAEMRDDVLLIMVDTLRADHLGVYGARSARTSCIDSLARRGTTFTNVDAHSPITGPSHASYFLSRVPSSTGMLTNHRGTLDSTIPTLAEWLRAAGYDTRGTISINPIRARDGFARGFASYEEQLGAAFLRAGEKTVAIAESLLTSGERPAAQPWFTFVHVADPHEPYDDQDGPSVRAELLVDGVVQREFRVSVFEPGFLPLDVQAGETRIEIRCEAEVRQRRFDFVGGTAAGAKIERIRPASRPTWLLKVDRPGSVRIAYAFEEAVNDPERRRARYRSEVAATDRQVSRILEALRRSGRADRSWVIFAADHGESLGGSGETRNARRERNHFGHVISLREPYVHVPLIIVPPKASRSYAGAIDDRLAAPIDFVPTLCAALDLEEPPTATGIDLFGTREDNRAVLLETHAPEAPKTRYALRTQRYKLIWTPVDDHYELYDLQEDPDEAFDLHESQPQLMADMRTRLDRRVEGLLGGSDRSQPALDDETIAALKSLGYLE